MYSGIGDDTSRFLQHVGTRKNYYVYSFHIGAYIARPDLLLVDETLIVEVTSKPYRINSVQDTDGIKEYDYKIEITRRTTQIDFEVKRGATSIITMSHGYSGGTKFVYFSLVVGGGALYFTDPTTVMAKYYETFHVFEVGQTPQRALNTFEEATDIKTLISFDSDKSNRRWMKVEYKPPAGATDNTPGFRIISLTPVRGVYPHYLLSNVEIMDKFPRCYLHTETRNHCISMALLEDPSDTQTLSFSYYQWSQAYNMENQDSLEICKVAYNPVKCLLPKPGYIVNIEKFIRTPIGAYGKISLQDYENMSPELKNFVYLFENNVGTKYMVSCPYSCKLRWI